MLFRSSVVRTKWRRCVGIEPTRDGENRPSPGLKPGPVTRRISPPKLIHYTCWQWKSPQPRKKIYSALRKPRQSSISTLLRYTENRRYSTAFFMAADIVAFPHCGATAGSAVEDERGTEEMDKDADRYTINDRISGDKHVQTPAENNMLS